MCKADIPKPVAPAAAPPPPLESAEVKQGDPMNDAMSGDADQAAKRRGRSALRIPLSGSGGGGLNIPTG